VIWKTFVETEDELMTDFLFLIMHAGNSISKTFTQLKKVGFTRINKSGTLGCTS